MKGFRRIPLPPGGNPTVEFTLGAKELSFLNEQMSRVVEPGTVEVLVGSNSADVQSVRLEFVQG